MRHGIGHRSESSGSCVNATKVESTAVVKAAASKRKDTMTAGRAVVTLGLILVVAGLLLEFAPALRLGRLPGDFSFGGGNFRVYVPLGTSILLSVLLTLLFGLFGRR